MDLWSLVLALHCHGPWDFDCSLSVAFCQQGIFPWPPWDFLGFRLAEKNFAECPQLAPMLLLVLGCWLLGSIWSGNNIFSHHFSFGYWTLLHIATIFLPSDNFDFSGLEKNHHGTQLVFGPTTKQSFKRPLICLISVTCHCKSLLQMKFMKLNIINVQKPSCALQLVFLCISGTKETLYY